MTPPADASMAPPMTTDTRLAILEDGVERLTDTIKDLTAEVRKNNETLAEVAVLRADVARLAVDVTNASLTQRQNREEMNARIDRTKGLIGDLEAKHDQESRKLWFWHGAAWGAGAMLAFTVGLLGYMAKGALEDIRSLQREVHAIELEHKPRGYQEPIR